MDRRSVLAGAAAAASLGPAGCTAITGDDERRDTSTDTAREPDAVEDIFVVLHNQVGEEVTVSVTITAGDSVALEEQVAIDVDEIGTVPTGITERGRYEFSVSVEGGGESRATFEFREYDLEMGSNVVVWIDDGIRIAKED